VAALAIAIAQARRARRAQPLASLASLALTGGAGAAVGLAVAMVYAAATGGRLVPTQVALATYFATGLLLLLKLFDFALIAALARAFRLPLAPPAAVDATAAADAPDETTPEKLPRAKPPRRLIARAVLAGVLRVLILAGVGLPYVMASVLTYRPKVRPADDPTAQLGLPFEQVTFDATDGTRIVGWFIPASPRTARDEPWDGWGKQTAIVAHGLAASKSNQLVLARLLPEHGFNVLIFDFRAHGESGGQLTTFGDRERRDVLGAVRWLRANRAAGATRIVGVGASMGAAALIAAAADDSDEGRAIEAIAAYGTYDHLGGLTRSVTTDYFFEPLRTLLVYVGLPLASVQTGANLSAFEPAALANDLWPRPLLVIHGRKDEIIRFDHGQALYDRAPEPKGYYWLPEGTHNDIVTNETAARVVAAFLRLAKPVPMI
jgi:uncharacterized protein